MKYLEHRFSARDRQEGFTIVELMIATLVFSMVLLVCSMAIVHIGRVYYKGMVMNRTQDISRKVVDDIVRSIQFGHSSQPIYGTAQVYSGVEVKSVCVNRVRFSYTTSRSLGDGPNQSRHVLWRDVDDNGNCTPQDLTQAVPSSATVGIEMLGSNMRVSKDIVVTAPTNPGSDVWNVSVVIAYGDDNDFEPASPASPGVDAVEAFTICKGAESGGQFCAVSPYHTNVEKRLR